MFASTIMPRTIEGSVTGADVLQFQDEFALMTKDLLRVLSITKATLKKCKEHPSEPVEDVALALTVRLYLMHPWLVESPRMLDMRAFYDSIGGEATVKKRLLSVLFGRDANTGYLWLDRGKRPTVQMYRLIKMVANEIDGGLEKIFAEACKEAVGRGVAPFSSGSWTMPANGSPSEIPFSDLASTGENSRRGRVPQRKGNK